MAILCKDYNLLYIMIGGTGCTSVGKVLRDHLGGDFLPEEHISPSSENGYRSLEQKHNTLQELIEFDLLSPTDSRKYLKVANVRNPFDVYATIFARFYGPDIEAGINNLDGWIYVDKSGTRRPNKEVEKSIQHFKAMISIARDEGFDAWLEKQIGWKSRFKKRVKSALLKKSVVNCKSSYRILDEMDEYIRFEHLEEDLNKVLQKVGYSKYISLPNANPTSGKKHYTEYYSPRSRALIESVFQDELLRFGYTY